MNITEIKKLIQQELPKVLQSDKTFRSIVQDILREDFADKRETTDRFELMLAEMRQDRSEYQAEMYAMREESERKWQEQKAQWEKQDTRWKKQDAQWEKQDAENRVLHEESKAQLDEIRAMREESQLFIRKYNSNIGALGSRWGIQTEGAFRNALKGILEESFDIKVFNVTEFDHEGEVFGRPDQIELDIIIRNGLLIICEIKSSMSKSDMHAFSRKVHFYEKHHNKKANRQIVISPMLDRYAHPVAETLGIEVYSYAEDVNME